MTEQQWIIWEPVPCLANRYSIDHLRFSGKGLKIVLSEMKQEYKTVEIIFRHAVIAYTKTDESFVLDLEGNLKQVRESLRPRRWIFFTTINSEYVRRIVEQSNGTVQSHAHWVHFVILADDAMIDIVADYEPDFIVRDWDIRIYMLLYKERIIPIILRYFPQVKIILYGPRSRAEVPVEKYGINQLQIALDTGFKIDAPTLQELKKTLSQESAVSVPCDVVDFHAVSEELRQQIVQEGIDWVKAKDI